MSWITATRLRLKAVFRRRQLDRDLEDELSFHLAMREQDYRRQGRDRAEARRQARLRFGNRHSWKEACREMWTFARLETWLQDLRYALRFLRGNPAFTLLAVSSLALGIGGNAAMFSILKGVLIQQLPYREPQRLVQVTGYYPKGAVQALQELSRTMDVAAFTTDSEFNWTGQGEALRMKGSAVSASFFSVLGADAQLGRTFLPEEDRPGRERVAVISRRLWQEKFAADAGVIGSVMTVGDQDLQVVGVMPADFGFPSPDVQIWRPLRLDPSDATDFWGSRFMPLMGRLRPGVSLDQARNEIRPLIAQLLTLFPYPMAPTWNADATATPLQDSLTQGVRGKLLLLQFAVGFVLLIACANMAALLLARAATRNKGIALRAALGASRERIVRQLLTESLLIACLGGGLGLLLAFATLPAFILVLPQDLATLPQVGVDAGVLAFSLLLALLTGLAFGMAPAWSTSRADLAQTMRAGGRSSGRASGLRLRSSLIAAELALAVVLSVCAGLLIKSLWLLGQVHPGFSPQQIISLGVFPNQSRCPQRGDCVSLYDELLRRVRGLNGVAEAAAANTVPFDDSFPAVPLELEGHPLDPSRDLAPMLWAGAVTPEYFHFMRIPILQGRAFRESDSQKSEPVVVVSAETAERFWPGENPLGKRIRVVWDEEWRTVVGVVGNVKQFDLAHSSPDWLEGALYMPYPQSAGYDTRIPSAMTLLARVAVNDTQAGLRLHRLVAAHDPRVAVGPVRSLQALLNGSTAPSRLLMWLFVGFGGFALLLAAVGTYGVVSYNTSQRTFEMAIRAALGASRGRIVTLVLKQSLQLGAAGLAVGAVTAPAVCRMLGSFLYGISADDPFTYLTVGGLLICVALIAGYLPARRASSVDPLIALRNN